MCILIFQTCLLKRILSIYIVKFRLYYVATIIDPGSTRVGLGWVWPGSGLTWGGSDPGRVWHEAGQTRVGFWPKWVWPGSGPNPTQPDPLRPLTDTLFINDKQTHCSIKFYLNYKILFINSSNWAFLKLLELL